MVNWIAKLFGRDFDDMETVISVNDLEPSAGIVEPPPAQYGDWTGDKYYGGYGSTQIYEMNYYELRQKSSQLFRDNLYARGLIRRLVTNIINTGLVLESQPDETILGISDEIAADYSELLETRYSIYARNPKLCDYIGQRTHGEIQRTVLEEALIDGDVLVVWHMDRITGLPKVQIIGGDKVVSPMQEVKNEVKHGVEIDKEGRQVAYWVEDRDGNHKRIPAFGPKSGRRVAKLIYGTDMRHDDVRGEPILAIIAQSTREIDRYRDSAQRKAVVNSIIAGSVEKTEDKMGTKPLTAGSVRKSTAQVDDDTNSVRTYKIAEQIPGIYIEELQQGERLVPYPISGTDINFGKFEEAMIQGIAWACEIPPEILRLAFSSNYSASQAAINEFKMFLNKERTRIGENLLQDGYVEWMVSESLAGKINLPGFLDAYRDAQQYDVLGAWTNAEWSGAIKPSTDLVKQAKGYQMLREEGLITRSRAARETTGSKFLKVVKIQKRENQLMVEAARPLMEFEKEAGGPEEAARFLSAVTSGEDVQQFMVNEG